jgi:hypothetical protein
MANFELYCKRITQLCGRSVIARVIRYLTHTYCVSLFVFSWALLLKCRYAVTFASSSEIIHNFGKYVTSVNDAVLLCKPLATVCARTQESESQKKEFEEAKSNIAAEKSVGLRALRIREVLSSILSHSFKNNFF